MAKLQLDRAEISIRPFHPDDAADYYNILSEVSVMQMVGQVPSLELAEVEQWATSEQPGRHRLIADWNGRVVGLVQLTQKMRPRLMHSGTMSLVVHPEFWQQGIGSRLLEAGLDLADNWLNLSRVQLEIFTHNHAAIRLAEKFGFAQEGVQKKVSFGNGRFWDDLIMARLNGPFPGPEVPAPPSPAPPPVDFLAEDVLIRPPQHSDLDDLYAAFHHPLVARTTLQMPSQEIGATKKRLETQVKKLHRFVSEVNGKTVGMITLYQSDEPKAAHKAGLGMMVHPAYWGKGIGSRLMETVVNLADGWLNIQRIELEVNVDNPAGVRLYRKFGFEIEGTYRWHAFGDGRLADSYFMARLR